MKGNGDIVYMTDSVSCSLPVLFWSQFLSCVVVIGAALAPSYAGFTVARTIQGLVNTAPQIIGLSIVHDMYPFHDRTRKINIWIFCCIAGPSLGPFVSGLIITKLAWREDFGIMSALYGFSFILTMLLGDETLYDKENDIGKINEQPKRKGLITQQALLVAGFTGAKQKGRPNVLDVLKHTISIAICPHVLVISKLDRICRLYLIFD
jgi:MFS family permease